LSYCFSVPQPCLPDMSSKNTFTCLSPWSIPSFTLCRIRSTNLFPLGSYISKCPNALFQTFSEPCRNTTCQLTERSSPDCHLTVFSTPTTSTNRAHRVFYSPYITKWILLALLACPTSRTLFRPPCSVMSSNRLVSYAPAYLLIEKPSRNR